MWGFGEKQEACSVLAADKDACIDSWGEKQKNALISSACQYLQTISHMHHAFLSYLLGHYNQFQRKWICRGRSAPSFTNGLWNSRPAREWIFAQQNSQ